jgi:hypothetical protein
VTYTGAHGGSVGLAGGIVTCAPATDYVGSDAFTYTINDGHGGTAVGTVVVTVAADGGNPPSSIGGVVIVGTTRLRHQAGVSILDILVSRPILVVQGNRPAVDWRASSA